MKFLSFIQSRNALWLGIVLFIVLIISLLLPIQPNDYWWYVRLGKEIVNTGGVPTVDSFSSTQFGQPTPNHSWLSAVLFWGLHQIGGNSFTVLIRAIIIAVFYAILWNTCRLTGAGPRLAALVTLFAVLAGSNNWAMRPQIFSYPLFALTLYAILKWRVGHSGWVWALPVISVLWVNLHGAFVLCFLLVGAALVGGGGNRRILLYALGGMGVTSLLNPRGWSAWGYVFSLLKDPASQQLGAEWSSPTIDVWQGLLFYLWLLLFPLLISFSKKTLSWTEWLWFLGFGIMAISGLRYVIWFLAILTPLTAFLLITIIGNRIDKSLGQGIPVFNVFIVIMLVLLPFVFLPGIRETWWAEAPPVLSSNTPVEAVDWLIENPEIQGKLWSELSFSSYLIFALPERPVWIDTRFELYPMEQWQQYIDISSAAPNWSDNLEMEGVVLMMINRDTQKQLFGVLDQSESWQLGYKDQTAAIFIQKSEDFNP